MSRDTATMRLELSRFSALACMAAMLGTVPASAAGSEDYASAWLGERLRYDRPYVFWSDLVARPRVAEPAQTVGPRSWNPHDQSPWANTFGTPAESQWQATTVLPKSRRPIRVCSCYLPADARSWDGGALTDADIVRLCRAQCF